MKRLLALILSIILIYSSCSPLTAYSAEKKESTTVTQDNDEEKENSDPEEETTSETTRAKKKKTVVEDLPETLNEGYNNILTATVKIKPASPARKVKLQLYNSSKKKYKTIKTYKTKKAKTARLELTFPKKYRKKTTGKWRIIVEGNDTAKKYVSKPIIVTTKNYYFLYLNAITACVYCTETGQVLYGKEMHRKRKQASTTKIMTGTLLIESGELGKNTKITKEVANTPYGNAYMKVGDVYRNRDLLYTMLLPSSNDSAAAIAYAVSGSQKKFVKLMNKKAEEIGLEDTYYCNAHGLDAKKNHSSAYDVSRLMSYASQYDDFMKVIGTAKYSYYTVRYHKHKVVKSTDKLKGYSKRHLGAKTGFTSTAKYCFASVYKYKGKHYCVTVMGNSSTKKRWEDMKKIYKYINKNANEKY